MEPRVVFLPHPKTVDREVVPPSEGEENKHSTTQVVQHSGQSSQDENVANACWHEWKTEVIGEFTHIRVDRLQEEDSNGDSPMGANGNENADSLNNSAMVYQQLGYPQPQVYQSQTYPQVSVVFQLISFEFSRS